MKTSIHLIAGIVLACLNTVANAAVEPAAIEQKIETALYRRDATLLAEAEADLGVAAAAQPKKTELLYLDGFAAYARATFEYGTKDKKALEKGLVQADKLLADVKGEPWASEAVALRGYITGQLIGVRGRMSGMTLGPKMMKQTSAALDGAPESGRAMTFHAVTLLNTPEMYGGNPREALKLLARAVAVFEKQSAAGSPVWGEAQAWYWLAKARIKTGDLAGAKEAAQEALTCEPDYRLVKRQLIPEIEKALGAK